MARTLTPTRAAPVLTASVLATLVLAGCASMAPPYVAPELPVAPTFDTATSRPVDAVDPGRIGWREHFADPALQTLIEMALAHNRDLRSAMLRVDEARAAAAIQRSSGEPSLNAQGSAERSRLPAGLSPTGSALSSNQFQLGVGLASWEIDFWGAVRSRNDAALQSFLATDAARRAATLTLVAQVADIYLALRETDERIALARQTIASREESVRIFTRRVEVGATSRLNLTQVQVLLTQAQALGAQLEQARAAQGHALTLLIGVPTALKPSAIALAPPASTDALQPGLPSDLLLNRPDIVAAEHRLRATHADIGAARAAYFPRVALTGGLSLASGELDDLFQGSSRAWTFAPGITLPIFDGGRRDAQLESTQIRRELALAAYDKAVQSAFRDVADALSARRWLASQLAIAEAALAAQSERARLSQLRFDAGAAAFLEVLDAQRDLLATQQQTVQARRALLSNRVSLYAALGGGSLTLPESIAATAKSTER